VGASLGRRYEAGCLDLAAPPFPPTCPLPSPRSRSARLRFGGLGVKSGDPQPRRRSAM